MRAPLTIVIGYMAAGTYALVGCATNPSANQLPTTGSASVVHSLRLETKLLHKEWASYSFLGPLDSPVFREPHATTLSAPSAGGWRLRLINQISTEHLLPVSGESTCDGCGASPVAQWTTLTKFLREVYGDDAAPLVATVRIVLAGTHVRYRSSAANAGAVIADFLYPLNSEVIASTKDFRGWLSETLASLAHEYVHADVILHRRAFPSRVDEEAAAYTIGVCASMVALGIQDAELDIAGPDGGAIVPPPDFRAAVNDATGDEHPSARGHDVAMWTIVRSIGSAHLDKGDLAAKQRLLDACRVIAQRRLSLIETNGVVPASRTLQKP